MLGTALRGRRVQGEPKVRKCHQVHRVHHAGRDTPPAVTTNERLATVFSAEIPRGGRMRLLELYKQAGRMKRIRVCAREIPGKSM